MTGSVAIARPGKLNARNETDRGADDPAQPSDGSRPCLHRPPHQGLEKQKTLKGVPFKPRTVVSCALVCMVCARRA